MNWFWIHLFWLKITSNYFHDSCYTCSSTSYFGINCNKNVWWQISQNHCKIIVVYNTIPNVVNMKFQDYLQIHGEIHFNCRNFSHDINLLFFKIYVLNEIFGGKMFSHSKFCKGNCLLLTSLFWILLKVFNIHDCTFIISNTIVRT